jgi:hypothetical protein
MSKDELYRELLTIFKEYDVVWGRITNVVIKYVKNSEKEGAEYGRTGDNPIFVDEFIDRLCLDGAWISDRISGYQGFPSSSTYNKSLAKKIRKALGYKL